MRGGIIFNTYEINTLAKLRIEGLATERHLNREVRAEMTKRMAQRKLRRAVEKLLETDGGAQSVLDVINHVALKAHGPRVQKLETSCCT